MTMPKMIVPSTKKGTLVDINEIIRTRRAIYPIEYKSEHIPDDVIWRVLESANWAPTHRRTEPWRFIVFRNTAKTRLGEYVSDYYKTHTPQEQFSEEKWKRTRAKAEQSSCVIAICMQRDPEARLPEWEEIAAVACSVQNMWLTCHALGIGCYWSSPKAATNGEAYFGLPDGQRCLGLFYMGWADVEGRVGRRHPIDEKVQWKET